MTTAEVTSQGFPHSANGARIRRARNLTALSQENFAPLVGTTRRHMIRLENGEHLPSGDLRDRIVEATGTKEQIEASDDVEEDDYVTVLFTRAREIAHERANKKAALLTIAVAALISATAAQASPPLIPPMASRLTALAQAAAGKPIVILVDPESPGSGQTPVVGEPVIMLGKRVYRSAVEGGSYGLFILLHETGHATGIRDEHQADCFALHHFKRALRFFHLTKRAAHDRWLDALEINRESLSGYGCSA